MRVFGYSRVSTSEQADEGASLDLQQQQIAGYAMMKGWRVNVARVRATPGGRGAQTPLAVRKRASPFRIAYGRARRTRWKRQVERPEHAMVNRHIMQ